MRLSEKRAESVNVCSSIDWLLECVIFVVSVCVGGGGEAESVNL